LKNWIFIRKLNVYLWRVAKLSKHLTIPFFQGQTLYDVVYFFYKGIVEGNITTRASSVAFSFFLALFPAIIFLFTLIPYIPIQGFQQELFEILHDVLPPTSYEVAESTIDDIVNNKHGGLLSFGFILALIFATNGTSALISNFNITVHHLEVRNFWKQELVAIFLTIVISFFVFIGIALIIFTENFTGWLIDNNWLPEQFQALVQWSRWLLLVAIIFLTISFLYYFGPANRKLWRFLSPGSLLTTLLILLGSYGFSYYVNNFAQYNKLYGSIGTLLVILLWIYLNSIFLIIGFEFNASIAHAKKSRWEQELDLEHDQNQV